MAHAHAHGHPHGHSHGPPLAGGADATGTHRAFAVGLALNVGFIVIEVIYGLVAHSVALLADAAHNLSDVLGLGLAWGAMALARRKPSSRRTYGLRRATVLAALANAVLIFTAVGGVAGEALSRLGDPRAVDGLVVLVVAAAGVVVNGGSAALFWRASRGDLNVRGAFLHLAADAVVSLAVVVAGALVWRTGAAWIDPAVSLAVSVAVLWSTWGLLRDATNLALDAVPDHVDPERVRAWLADLPGVRDVHDLHIWALSTTETALTAHLVLRWGPEPPGFLGDLDDELRERFGIAHVTVQLEPDEAESHCRSDCAELA